MLEFFMSNWWWILPILFIGIPILVAVALYRLVPANEAHVVIQRGKRRTFSSMKEYSDVGKAAYFKVPPWVPGWGMIIHKMPLEILSISIPDFLAFDENRARFLCDIRAYVVIKDSTIAAMRFPSKEKGVGVNIKELADQISKVVQATTRDSTTKRNIREIINDREGIIEKIKDPLAEALQNWGLILSDIELVEFKDPTEKEYGEKEPPHVIKDISAVEEIKINSEMRRKNAEETKAARVTEAETEEFARRREIEKEEQIGIREKKKLQEIAKEEKIATEEQLEIEKVKQVKTEKIMKERAIVEANKQKEVEEVNKTQKKLIGEGDRLMKEEQAKGEAAPIREKGLAEAMAKDKLQAALNKFTPGAIQTLIAEIEVERDRQIGVNLADAYKTADIRVFTGGGDSKTGFDMGALIEGVKASSPGTATAVQNKIARPNDIGLKDWGVVASVLAENEDLRKQFQTALRERTVPTETHKPVIETKKKTPRKKLP